MGGVRDRAASVRHLKYLVRHPQWQQNDRRRTTNVKIEQKRNKEVDASEPKQHRVHAHLARWLPKHRDRSRSYRNGSPEEADGTHPGDQVIREVTPSSEHLLHD